MVEKKFGKTGWTSYLYVLSGLCLIVATAIVATGIITDFVRWDTLNRDFCFPPMNYLEPSWRHSFLFMGFADCDAGMLI